MEYTTRIVSIINAVAAHLINKLGYDANGNFSYIDANEQKEISAHYGASHFAASLIILGKIFNNTHYYTLGRNLLKSILLRWAQDKKLPSYHYDFNNFAFIISHEYLDEEDELRQSIKDIVLSSPDSNHNTINWLPMRLLVNVWRAKWGNNQKYNKEIEKCISLIKKATNKDGGIEDRLPKGVSFNLQYDISSFATISLAHDYIPDYNFSNGLKFLLRNIAPDGDINYQGRGCNQVFAWGPWIYILSTYNCTAELLRALDFLEPKLHSMLSNDSMMLNDWPGSEQYLWWDYHYESVYAAHLLLWLILAYIDENKMSFVNDNDILKEDTGLRTVKDEDFFISIFEGRTEYLSENGPAINLIWTKKNGIVFKGIFGPWRGLFGNNHTYEDVEILNYFGLIEIKKQRNNKIVNKLNGYLKTKDKIDNKFTKKPIFCPIKIETKITGFSIIWRLKKNVSAYINIPSFCNLSDMTLKLSVDNVEKSIICIAKIRNQYDWLNINQSQITTGKEWRLTFTLDKQNSKP